MRTKVCSQCKKLFEPKVYAERICSDECRMKSKRSSALKNAASAARKSERRKLAASGVPLIPGADKHNVNIGQKVMLEGQIGQVIERVLPGQSVADVWHGLLENQPELYSAIAAEAPRGIVASLRYILKVELESGTYIKWPYLYSIKGVVDESQSKAPEESSPKG